MKTFSRLAFVFLTLTLVGCTSGLINRSTLVPATASVTPESTPLAPTGGTETPGDGLATAQPDETVHVLTIWVPPQFDPESSAPAGALLKARLQEFENAHLGVKVNVRIKAETGPGSLLETLSTANAAAPDALPDLVSLPQADLEVAALKGLLTPLDGLVSGLDNSDWYSYARQLSLVQGSTFGLPFAGDAMVMMYRPAKIANPPADWASVLRLATPLAFPAADSESLFSLALYKEAGGKIEDAQRRPTLSVDMLTSVLEFYSNGARQGVFPYTWAQLDSDEQSWQAYKDQRAQMVISWTSRYLSEKPADTSIKPLPANGDRSVTLATGWLWALSNPQSEHKALSAKLAEYLSDSEFLGKWTAAAGYLPTQPAALAAWTDQSMQAVLSQVVLSAEARPSSDLLGSIGSVLRDATLKALKGQDDARQAAQAAADRLKGP